MRDTLVGMAGSPFNDRKIRDEKLLDEFEELFEAAGIYEQKLATIGHHANKLSRRFSDMVQEGGILIDNCGPNDHRDGECAMCGNCRNHLILVHSLLKQQNIEAYNATRKKLKFGETHPGTSGGNDRQYNTKRGGDYNHRRQQHSHSGRHNNHNYFHAKREYRDKSGPSRQSSATRQYQDRFERPAKRGRTGRVGYKPDLDNFTSFKR